MAVPGDFLPGIGRDQPHLERVFACKYDIRLLISRSCAGRAGSRPLPPILRQGNKKHSGKQSEKFALFSLCFRGMAALAGIFAHRHVTVPFWQGRPDIFIDRLEEAAPTIRPLL